MIVVPLKSLCQIRHGGTPSKANAAFWDGTIPWVSPKDMKSSVLSDSSDHITQEAINDSAASVVPEQSILVVVRSGILAHSFPVAQAAKPLSFNQDIKGLTPDSTKVDPDYLYWFVRSEEPRVLAQGVKKGATVHSVQSGFIENLQVPLPERVEQRRIVDLLSRAEGIVRLRREAEKKAAELIPSLFTDMFGAPAANPKRWPLVKLADVCGKCATRDPKKRPDEEFTYIDIAAIDNEHGQVSGIKTILGMDAPSRARQVVQSGDVIVSTVRPNLRGSAWIPQHLDGQVCSTGFCVLRPSNKTTTGFIYAVIRSDWFVSELMKHVRGAQYPAVSDKDVFGVQIPLPPLSAQQEFASRLDAIRSIQSQQSMAITKAQATFDALLARVFNQ